MASHELTDAEVQKLLNKFNLPYSVNSGYAILIREAYALGLNRDIMHVSYKELKQTGEKNEPR